jgi:hypothetical protein
MGALDRKPSSTASGETHGSGAIGGSGSANSGAGLSGFAGGKKDAVKCPACSRPFANAGAVSDHLDSNQCRGAGQAGGLAVAI